MFYQRSKNLVFSKFRYFTPYKRKINTSTIRNGYIVLVPEIGEDLPEKNPLLRNDGLPEFNNITIENCIAAIGKQSYEFESGVGNLEEGLEKYDEPIEDIVNSVLNQLEHLGIPLDTTWGLSKTLYLCNKSLMPTKTYMSIHERARKARSFKYNSVNIYNLFKKFQQNATTLNEEKDRTVRKFLLEGKLNGLEMDDVKKAILEEILVKINTERSKFQSKLDLATKQFTHTITDPNLAKDIPEHLLLTMAHDKKQPLKGPWKVTLFPFISEPFMEYCPDRVLRWNIWQASVQRCSGYADKALETSTHIEKIRSLRRDQAKHLGYKSFVDISMETKMAGNVENVKTVLNTLRESAFASQISELDSLHTFAAERGFEGQLELWDIPYWRRKQRRSLYDWNDDKLREYFSLSSVLDGLFKLCEKYFDVNIVERQGVNVWHKDVRFFDVFDRNEQETPIAGFYFDPYAREENKLRVQKNSCWMVSIRNRSKVMDSSPLAAMIFNFSPPGKDVPCLLNFSETVLLFNKFGHSLQHLLTRASYSEVAGFSNLEWDAVQVCSNVFSLWMYDSANLQLLGNHYSTGEKLPPDVIKNMQNARNHMAGYDLCKELYLSMLDLELYSSSDYWLEVVKRLWPNYIPFTLDKYDSHPCSFGAIFSEEWAAAYYSNVWSRMLAADVFTAFSEAQNNEASLKEVGKRFRDTFLALGGSSHPNKVFRRFRGRDPSPNALISLLGFNKTKH